MESEPAGSVVKTADPLAPYLNNFAACLTGLWRLVQHIRDSTFLQVPSYFLPVEIERGRKKGAFCETGARATANKPRRGGQQKNRMDTSHELTKTHGARTDTNTSVTLCDWFLSLLFSIT